MANPYAGPIIDAHHHLWDLGLGRHPWLAATAARARRARRARPVAPQLSPRGLSDATPAGTMSSPPSMSRPAGRATTASARRAGWRRSTSRAASPPRYVAHVPLASRRSARVCSRRRRQFDRVVGVRDILSWDPDPARRFAARDGIMDDPAWRAGLALLARARLVFDLMVFPRQLRRRGAACAPTSPTSNSSSTIAAARSTATPRACAAGATACGCWPSATTSRSRSPTSSPTIMTGRSTACGRSSCIASTASARSGPCSPATFRSPACMHLRRGVRQLQDHRGGLFRRRAGRLCSSATAKRIYRVGRYRHRRADSRPESSSRPRISEPNRMLRQPGDALTTVIRAVIVTSRIAPGIVPA